MGQGAALALTLAVELPVAAAFLRRCRDGRIVAWPRLLAVVALASLLTHPLAWRAALALSPGAYAVGAVLIEVAVVAAEGALLRVLLPAGWRTAFVAALLANTASFGAGLLVWRASA